MFRTLFLTSRVNEPRRKSQLIKKFYKQSFFYLFPFFCTFFAHEKSGRNFHSKKVFLQKLEEQEEGSSNDHNNRSWWLWRAELNQLWETGNIIERERGGLRFTQSGSGQRAGSGRSRGILRFSSYLRVHSRVCVQYTPSNVTFQGVINCEIGFNFQGASYVQGMHEKLFIGRHGRKREIRQTSSTNLFNGMYAIRDNKCYVMYVLMKFHSGF